MKTRLVPALASVATAVTLTACGASSSDVAVVAGPRPAAQAQPAAALAPGTLGHIPDVSAAHTRIGYVNVAAVDGFGGPLGASEIRSLVLGTGAARLAHAGSSVKTAVQVGSSTVFDGAKREVFGGSATTREELAQASPDVSLITLETPSAVQSCLGDAAAQVIVGSAVVGRSAAVGAGIIDTADAPAGRKLLLCAAPHFVRELDPTAARLRRAFPERSVVADAEIGERDIITAAVSLDAISRSELRALLSGGPALTSLLGD